MSEISAYTLIKEKLQAIPNSRLKGSWFEKVSKRFLKEHDSADEYESIDLWSEWELRGNEGDRGIDMVITTTSKEYIAVQCKFHQDSVSLNDIATFLSKLQSGVKEVRFKKGIIISTSNLSSNALEEIEQIRSAGMDIDIDIISEEDFIYSKIDWEKFDPTKTQDELPLCDKKKPRHHQTEAIKATNRKHYGDNLIAEEEIFYYIYAIFHHKGYLEKYKNSLAKEALHIALSKDFKELSMLGKELGELHLNYECGEMHDSVEYTTLMNAEVEGYYDVDKMTKKGDRILYPTSAKNSVL